MCENRAPLSRKSIPRLTGIVKAPNLNLKNRIIPVRKPLMPTQELFVLPEGDIWEVRLGKYLLSTRATQAEALEVARVIARDIAERGVKSKLVVSDMDGNLSETSPFDPAGKPAANSP